MNTVAARPLVGIVCVLAAASLWGTTGTVQAVSGASLPSLWFGALRLAFAALFLVALVAIGGHLAGASWRRLPPWAALGAGLCMAVYNLAFFAGVRHTGVAVGTAIALGSGPIWAGLLQSLFQRRQPSATWWAGSAAAVMGGVLLCAGSAAATVSLPGTALCLVSGLAYATYTLLNQRMVVHAPAVVITLSAFGVAALLALPVAWVQAGVPAPGLRDWAAVVFTGVATAGVAYLLFSHALHHISPASGVTLALVEPLVAFVLAVAVLGEGVSAVSLAGLGLVVAGLLGVVRAELVTRRCDAPAAAV